MRCGIREAAKYHEGLGLPLVGCLAPQFVPVRLKLLLQNAWLHMSEGIIKVMQIACDNWVATQLPSLWLVRWDA